jgi:hypothetical protein
MSSPQFPTYGRDDEPAPEEQEPRYGYAPPAPYGEHGYARGDFPDGGSHQFPHHRPAPADYTAGAPPYAPPQPPPTTYQPPPYGPSSYQPGQYGAPGHPQQTPYDAKPGQVQLRPADPRAARMTLAAALAAGIYGLLMITLQRVSLRDISQAPGSPNNHPLRTDVLDAIGQVSVLGLGGYALFLWINDLQKRRAAGAEPSPVELGGLALIGVSLIPFAVWLLMLVSTGLGAVDDTIDRLPTAYGWGGLGMLILAVGLGIGNRIFQPAANPVVRRAPDRPPWE